jgi:ureidoglycolate lyase
MSKILNIEPLSSDAFGMFGDVIGGDMPGDGVVINQGTTLKFDAQALSLDSNGGQAKAYLYRAQGQNLPLPLQMLERHRLGSQTFVPLNGVNFIVVVAASSIDSKAPDLASLRAFWADGRCAVTLDAGTWHHGLIATSDGDFVVIERLASEVDCDTFSLSPAIELRPAQS